MHPVVRWLWGACLRNSAGLTCVSAHEALLHWQSVCSRPICAYLRQLWKKNLDSEEVLDLGVFVTRVDFDDGWLASVDVLLAFVCSACILAK